jgi:acetyl esterase
MALDDATAQLIADLASSDAKQVHEMTVAEVRALSAALTETAVGEGPEMLTSRDAHIRVSGGRIPVRIQSAVEDPRGLVVFYHGGGWVAGSVEDYDRFARELAARTACVVVSVGYRLAPEYRFPTPVDDAWTALLWVAERVEELTGADVPLLVAGDSAGGNLAAAVARRAFEQDGPELALQLLVYPVLDCDVDTLSYTDPENQLIANRQGMIWFWDHYVPDADARKHPDASPLQTVFLTGVADAVVITAEHDILRDEGELYAMRLIQAGVKVEHHRFLGQMHGFMGMIGLLPGADAGWAYVAESVDRCLGRLATARAA